MPIQGFVGFLVSLISKTIWVASPLSFFFCLSTVTAHKLLFWSLKGKQTIGFPRHGNEQLEEGEELLETCWPSASRTKLHTLCVKRLESFSCEDSLVFPPYHTMTVCFLGANLFIALAMKKFCCFSKLCLL